MTLPVGQNGTLQAALRLLACFHDHEELGATEAAELVGISSSAASRALITMAAEGFVERTPTGRYRIGLTVFTLGQLTLSRFRLRELAMPLITRVRDALDETTQIGVPMGPDVLYLDRLESRYTSWLHSEEYRRMPGGVSATGRAIAAFNSGFARAIERDGLVGRLPPRSTPSRLVPQRSATGAAASLRGGPQYTVSDVAGFRRELAETRRRGWAQLRDEKVVGLAAISAPILLPGPEGPTAIAALTVVGPTARVVGRRRAVSGAVLAAAAELAAAVEDHQRTGRTA